MKHKLMLCSILLMLSFATLASGKNLLYKNLAEAAKWSALPKAVPTSISLNKLPYKNILDAAKWSKLVNGRALSANLRKRNAHGSPVQGFDDPEALFAFGPGSGCRWGCCFKTCLRSAMSEELCIVSCGSCVVDGSTFGCAICAACGAVAAAAIEFCGLHCCVDPGC